YSLAQALLQSRNIDTESSLANLYGDLYQVLSQVERREGHIWQSVWQQQMGSYFTAKLSSQRAAFEDFSAGNRCLRLGMASDALDLFQSAEQSAEDPNLVAKAQLSRIKALRLSGRAAEASDLVNQIGDKLSFKAEFQQELDWEKLCLRVHSDRDPRCLVAATS